MAITQRDKAKSYRITMEDMRTELTPIERFFSYVIHAPVIEQLGRFISSALLRPRALLFGAAIACITAAAAYIFAEVYGAATSALISLAGFAAGWIIGNLYDTFQRAENHKKR